MTVLGLLVHGASAHVPIIYIAGPDEDWCAVLNGTIGNDVVYLLPGTYEGPCDARADLSDVPAEQTTVTSFDETDPAVFAGSTGDYVLRFSGERLQIRDVAFRDLPAGIDAIRVGGIKELWVKRVAFTRVAGRGVVQDGPVDELRVLDTAFHDVAHPLTAGGCLDCTVAELVVNDNLVRGATVGLRVGAGATGELEDNVLFGVDVGLVLDGTEGALMLSGAYVDAAQDGIVVAEGPVTVSASIVAGSPAVRAEAPTDTVFTGNTLHGTLALTEWGPDRGLRFVGNAALGSLPDLAGAEASANVACDAGCFADPSGHDYYPAPDSPLRDAGDPDAGEDFCGRPRGATPTAGALQADGDRSFGGVVEDFKSETDCTLPAPLAPTGDTGEPEVPGPDPDPEAPPAPVTPSPSPAAEPTGCASTPPGGLGGFGLLVVGLISRRPASGRRRPRCRG